MQIRRRFLLLTVLLLVGSQCLVAEEPTYTEPHRPAYHFTPAKNWANDPNGLVYHDGEYHLFYQHNPEGNVWGHMSWGHAISPDLVHWKHLPVAIPETDQEMAFSGSAVVDAENTSGLGTKEKPPLVAIYTAYFPGSGRQMQYLASSIDRGRTWTPYMGNPVLDIGLTDFRDPKVFWYEPDGRWVMVLALPTERKVSIYTSPDLKKWTHRSNFGPAGAIGGAWECPDLFELPIEDRPGRSRWVLQVDLDRRGVAGGSGSQYFIGSFDGEEFVLDAPTPAAPLPAGRLLAGFEEGLDSWLSDGKAFRSVARRSRGHIGRRCLHSGADGDAPMGSVRSRPFMIDAPYLNFLLGGGRDAERLAIELLVDGKVVRSETGKNGDVLDWVAWDVSDLEGEQASLRVRDESDALWGHIVADHFVLSDQPARPSVERGRWVDYGKDFYALTSWSNTGDRRIWLAWMNNWHYANEIPTHPWRSAMTLPREVSLRIVEGSIQLVQRPVRELRQLRGDPVEITQRAIDGETQLDLVGDQLEIEVSFAPGEADEFGLVVLGGTRIGYGTERSELFMDRREGGNVDFHPLFPARTTAPLSPDGKGRIRLHVFVDRSSVEVFANGGLVTMTNRVFQGSDKPRVSLFSRGGTAKMRSFKLWSLQSIWDRP